MRPAGDILDLLESLGACAPRRQSLIDETETCTASPSSLIFAALRRMPSSESNTAGENVNGLPPIM